MKDQNTFVAFELAVKGCRMSKQVYTNGHGTSTMLNLLVKARY